MKSLFIFQIKILFAIKAFEQLHFRQLGEMREAVQGEEKGKLINKESEAEKRRKRRDAKNTKVKNESKRSGKTAP